MCCISELCKRDDGLGKRDDDGEAGVVVEATRIENDSISGLLDDEDDDIFKLFRSGRKFDISVESEELRRWVVFTIVSLIVS